jgi:CheY-like chemotaxis protein
VSPRAHIVVIDDDHDLRQTLVEALELEGYELHATGDAATGLVYLAGGAPADVILLDLMMPGMNGWEFCARRAELPVIARIPVIALTARRQQDYPPGADAVVHKPFEIATLVRAIDERLALARRPS